MTEDERYRTSTQFRLWSYTTESLYTARSNTNQLAAERVRDAVRRAREARNTPHSASTSETENGKAASAIVLFEAEIECLTVEEELKLVAFFCRQTMQAADFVKVPTDVKATAVQYLKRFYITNSLMTYSAADILKTALFFATKTENHYFRLTKFAEAIGKTTPEAVLASEFLLTQGLRFTFDVRHPFRALEGAVMELQGLAHGSTPILPGTNPADTHDKPQNMDRRIKEAHGIAREYLKTSAQITDVYFHFTPSQIMMASLTLADPSLMEWYIRSKIPSDLQMQHKVLSTIAKCADMLREVEPTTETTAEEKAECQLLAKKLKKCRNPEKMDLVGLQKAKREGEVGVDEKVVKKRKMEGAKRESDDLFGPVISK